MGESTLIPKLALSRDRPGDAFGCAILACWGRFPGCCMLGGVIGGIGWGFFHVWVGFLGGGGVVGRSVWQRSW